MFFRLVHVIATLAFSTLIQKATSSSSTFSTATSTVDLTDATSPPGVISPDYALEGYEKCTAANGMNPQKIKDGFSEMIKMIQGSFLGYYPTIDWNGGAAQDFWGPYQRNADYRSAIKGSGFTSLIKNCTSAWLT